MSVIHSVVVSGRSRLRPVLMTTLTTILGMVPMAIGGGEGSEMWQPLGVLSLIHILEDIILIPQSATQEIQDKKFVYVLQSDNTLKPVSYTHLETCFDKYSLPYSLSSEDNHRIIPAVQEQQVYASNLNLSSGYHLSLIHI